MLFLEPSGFICCSIINSAVTNGFSCETNTWQCTEEAGGSIRNSLKGRSHQCLPGGLMNKATAFKTSPNGAVGGLSHGVSLSHGETSPFPQSLEKAPLFIDGATIRTSPNKATECSLSSPPLKTWTCKSSAEAASGSLLEMQRLRSHPRQNESDSPF